MTASWGGGYLGKKVLDLSDGNQLSLCSDLTPMLARSFFLVLKIIQGNLWGIIDETPESLSQQPWEQSHGELPCSTQGRRTLTDWYSQAPCWGL